jgi:alpha-ketoglutarate-dependent 2,4-dichlorophenoxyacetate dioxygenase
MEIVEIVPGFVAEVQGVDLRREVGTGFGDAVTASLDQWPVLVFRGQDIDDDLQVSFTGSLGRQRKAEDRPYIGTVGNVNDDGTLIAEEDQRQYIARGSRVWHTDLSFRRLPDRYTVLSSRVLPRSGGHTEFCDTYASYAVLEDALKARVDQLVAVHDLRYSRRLLGLGLLETEQNRDFVTAQPLVLQNPRTGRKSLYLARHIASIVGMADDEAQELVAYLLDLATQPQFVFELDWGGPGTLAVWDNRATMHRGTPYNDTSEKRIMRRSAVVAPGVV